jgi:hypothetical protein
MMSDIKDIDTLIISRGFRLVVMSLQLTKDERTYAKTQQNELASFRIIDV